MKKLILASLLSVFSVAHAQTDFGKCNQILDQIEVPLNATLGDWATRPAISSTSELNVFRQAYEYFANNAEIFATDAFNESFSKDLHAAGGLDPKSRAYSQADKRAKAAEAKVIEDWKDQEKREAMIEKKIRNTSFGRADQDAEGSVKIGSLWHFKPDGKIDVDHFENGAKGHPTLENGGYSLGMPASATLKAKDHDKQMTYSLSAEKSYQDGKLNVRFKRYMNGAWGPDLNVEMEIIKDKCVLRKIQSESRSNFRSHKDNNSDIGIRRTFFSQENCAKAQSVLTAKEFHKQPANLVLSQAHTEVYYCPGSNSPLNYCKNANETLPYANLTPDPKPELEKYYAKFCKPFEAAIEKAPAAAASGGWLNFFGSGAK